MKKKIIIIISIWILCLSACKKVETKEIDKVVSSDELVVHVSNETNVVDELKDEYIENSYLIDVNHDNLDDVLYLSKEDDNQLLLVLNGETSECIETNIQIINEDFNIYMENELIVVEHIYSNEGLNYKYIDVLTFSNGRVKVILDDLILEYKEVCTDEHFDVYKSGQIYGEINNFEYLKSEIINGIVIVSEHTQYSYNNDTKVFKVRDLMTTNEVLSQTLLHDYLIQ